MNLPLYNPIAAPSRRPSACHAGLWFDKFCNQWPRHEDGSVHWSLKPFSVGQDKNRRDINPKLDWIKTVTNHPIGDQTLITEHATRLAALARDLGGHTIPLKTTSRLVTGLGREHPIENGFAWHPALGTPYLPGSSVKGLVRAWLEGGWCEQPVEPPTFHRVFGSDYRKGSGQHDPERDSSPQSGTVVFFDAIPTAPVQLKADVMTPHYGDYYAGKRDGHDNLTNLTPPADWLSPNPIPFLTVAPGQPFQFALVPRTRLQKDLEDCTAAVAWLEAALVWLGAGAKTAVGYGRFEKAEAAEKPATSLSAALGPRYKAGQRITATRVEDPKRKGRSWFQADDGYGGVVTGGVPPPVETGQTVKLEVAAVNQGQGYNFRLPRPAEPTSGSRRVGGRAPRRR